MSIFSALVRPIAYLSLPVILLEALSSTHPLARYYVRIGVYLSTLGAVSMWGAVVAVGMGIAGRRFDTNYVVARSFYHLAGTILGIRFTVEGEEHLETRPAVLVGNHQSMLDILYLGRIFPKRASIMAKKELQWTPGLGQFMQLSGAVFVDRGNNSRAVQSLMAAGETMKARSTSLWMFPEGTRSMRKHHDMLPFKKGAFHLAVQAGVPVVPVVCENYWKLYHKGTFGSGTLKIKVLPPISTTGLTAADVGDLANRVHDQMVAALREISDPLPSPTESQETKPSEEAKPLLESPDVPVVDQRAAASPTSTSKEEETLASPPSSAASESGFSTRRTEGSENGTETEEDEGMVLVGRPT